MENVHAKAHAEMDVQEAREERQRRNHLVKLNLKIKRLSAALEEAKAALARKDAALERAAEICMGMPLYQFNDEDHCPTDAGIDCPRREISYPSDPCSLEIEGEADIGQVKACWRLAFEGESRG